MCLAALGPACHHVILPINDSGKSKQLEQNTGKQNQPASNAHIYFGQTSQNHQTRGEDSVAGKMALGPQPQESRGSAE